MDFFWSGPEPGDLGSGSSLPDDMTGITVLSEADYLTAVAAAEAANDAASAAFLAAVASDKCNEAQAVYDEIVGIHPVLALSYAKMLCPTFEP